MQKPTLVILAAGEGRRLRPYTEDRPKCMVEFRNKPMLEWTLRGLWECEISPESVRVVGGYQNQVMKPLLEAHQVNNLIINQDFLTTNMVYSLSLALDGLEDVIICYSDIVWETDILKKLLQSAGEISVVIDKEWLRLWSARMENPLFDAETLKIGSDGRIVEIGKKPLNLSEITGQYIGMLRIHGHSLRLLKELLICLKRDQETMFCKMFLTDLLQKLIDLGLRVEPVFIEGGWVEIDSVEDLNRLSGFAGLKRGLK